jgi:alginate O-acetyltransferase complex protein AlgJ
MKARFHTYFLSVAFILLIGLPLLNFNGLLFSFERPNENRVFCDSLPFRIQQLDKFPAAFDRYYNDNFSFRTPLLTLVHRIHYDVFGSTPHRNDLLIGKQGWYFMGGEEEAIYEGREHFSEEVLTQFHALWKERIRFLKNKNIEVHWVICPIKHHVYNDMLPENVRKPKRMSRTNQLAAYLNRTFPKFVLNPVHKLKQARKKHRVYFQLDNHWNARAGWYVTHYLLQELKKDFPLIDERYLAQYKWSDSTKRDGIHKAMLGIRELSEQAPFTLPREEMAKSVRNYGFKVPADFPYPWKYEMRFKSGNQKAPRLLVIRDSFSDDLIPFLKEAFSESVFIFDNWEYALHPEIIDKVQPDVVLFITLESHLSHFLRQKN